MANKLKGTFSVAANYQVKMADALDPRVQWDSFQDLIVKNNWPLDGDIIYAYNGLIASVGREVWMLVDKDTFVKCLNNVGELNKIDDYKIVKNDDGSSDVVYNTRAVAEHYGWTIVGKSSDDSYSIDEHCLVLE